MLKSNDLFARFLGLDSFNWKMQLAPLVLVGCKTYFWCMDGKKHLISSELLYFVDCFVAR